MTQGRKNYYISNIHNKGSRWDCSNYRVINVKNTQNKEYYTAKQLKSRVSGNGRPNQGGYLGETSCVIICFELEKETRKQSWNSFRPYWVTKDMVL